MRNDNAPWARAAAARPRGFPGPQSLSAAGWLWVTLLAVVVGVIASAVTGAAVNMPTIEDTRWCRLAFFCGAGVVQAVALWRKRARGDHWLYATLAVALGVTAVYPLGLATGVAQWASQSANGYSVPQLGVILLDLGGAWVGITLASSIAIRDFKRLWRQPQDYGGRPPPGDEAAGLRRRAEWARDRTTPAASSRHWYIWTIAAPVMALLVPIVVRYFVAPDPSGPVMALSSLVATYIWLSAGWAVAWFVVSLSLRKAHGATVRYWQDFQAHIAEIETESNGSP